MRRSESVNATHEGVVLSPRSLATISMLPSLNTATQLYVVPGGILHGIQLEKRSWRRTGGGRITKIDSDNGIILIARKFPFVF